MKPALGYSWTVAPKQWQEFPAGEQLKQLEYELLKPRLERCFGYHMLKLGSLATEFQCSECTIPHQINLTRKRNGNAVKTGVIAEYDELPFTNHSLDLVVTSHILEFSIDPHQTLREIHRVLTPNGKLLITCFNPLSMLSLGKLWPFRAKSPLWKMRMFSVGRVKDWLNLLGFEIKEVEYTCYSSLVRQNPNLTLNFVQRMMAKMLPGLGSVCVIHAKKREWPLTPIRPRVRYKSAFRPAVPSAQANKLRN